MILVLCGKSGSGKDTVAKYMEDHSVVVDKLCSTTSRPQREGETEGIEYNFISRNDFEKRAGNNEFIEYRSYDTLVKGIPDTWYYGTAKETIDRGKNEAGIKVLIKDIEGAKAIKHYCEQEGIDFRCIYIDVPDAIRTERAKHRGSFDETEWNRRLAADKIDFAPEKIASVADKTVQNVDKSIQEISDDIYKYAIREDGICDRDKVFAKTATLEADNEKDDDYLDR